MFVAFNLLLIFIIFINISLIHSCHDNETDNKPLLIHIDIKNLRDTKNYRDESTYNHVFYQFSNFTFSLTLVYFYIMFYRSFSYLLFLVFIYFSKVSNK